MFVDILITVCRYINNSSFTLFIQSQLGVGRFAIWSEVPIFGFTRKSLEDAVKGIVKKW